MQRPKKITPKAGQESVWDYPRPPHLEAISTNIRIQHQGITLVNSNQALRMLETSHPPGYYIPATDIQMEYLQRTTKRTFCEFKGVAHYYDLKIENITIPEVAWGYDSPSKAYPDLVNHLAFYAHKVDTCFVGDEKVQAQEGDFYGGWITSNIVGPFKGGTGTWGW